LIRSAPPVGGSNNDRKYLVLLVTDSLVVGGVVGGELATKLHFLNQSINVLEFFLYIQKKKGSRLQHISKNRGE
jgi:hypothetical protein